MCSRLGRYWSATTSTSAMKFLLATILMREGISARTGGIWMNELAEKSTVSRAVQLESSSGKLEIRLWDTFNSVSRVHLMASLAGILLMTLWERLHETRLVFCISMKIASGTCCSWQSDRSRLLFSLASSHL